MKNKIQKNLLIVGLAIILFQQSCISIHSGNMSNISYYEQDETWVDVAIAKTTASYFILIGGNFEDLVYTKLKNELMLRYIDSTHLGLRNFITNERITSFAIFAKIKYTMTADVFRLKHPKEQGKLNTGKFQFEDNLQSTKKTIQPIHDSISINQAYDIQLNDKVYFITNDNLSYTNNPKIHFADKLTYGTIIKLSKSYATISYLDVGTNHFKIVRIAYDDIYKEIPFLFHFKGSIYKNNNILTFHSNLSGELILFNKKHLLLSSVNKEEHSNFFMVNLY